MSEKEALEAEVTLLIAEAKKLVCRLRKQASPTHLEKLEQDIRAAFTRAVSEVAPILTDEERVNICAHRLRWEEAKQHNPKISVIEHIDNTYPDRRDFGMLRRDLNDLRVDPKLYQALADWLRSTKNGKTNQLPSDFGLPKKSEFTDKLIKEINNAPDAIISTFVPSNARTARAASARRANIHRRKVILQVPRLAAE